MNLSNYLQMPPAPQSPATAGLSSAPAAASLTGVDAAGRFKLDFARIMAQQFQQLPSIKRQDLAALRAAISGDAARTGLRQTSAQTRDNHDEDTSAHNEAGRDHSQQNAAAGAESAANTRASWMARSTSGAHTSTRSTGINTNTNGRRADDSQQRKADEASDDERDNTARPLAGKARGRGQPPPSLETDPSVLWTAEPAPPADASTASMTPLAVGTPNRIAPTALNLPDGTQLQSVTLGPEVQIVTDPSRAPTPQSLLNFARDMGLDEASLRQLVGEIDADSAAAPRETVSALQSATPQSLLNFARSMGLNEAALRQLIGDGSGEALRGTDAPTHSTGLGALGTASAGSWLAAQQIQIHTASSVTNTAALLPGGNQWLQGGLLPAAPATTNTTSGTITLDVLTLNGADLPAAEITALAESFLAGDDASSSSREDTSHDGQPALPQASAPAVSHGAAGTREAGASAAMRPMAEVYQQLSDKLSSEMAARMHQQINASEWKMKFGLRPAHLGSVEIQLEMKDGKLHADLAADNPLTRELLQNGSQRLRESLANLGIQAERVSVGQGQTLFGQGQTGTQGQGASQQGQLEDNPNPSSSISATMSEPVRSSPKDPDSLLDLYA